MRYWTRFAVILANSVLECSRHSTVAARKWKHRVDAWNQSEWASPSPSLALPDSNLLWQLYLSADIGIMCEQDLVLPSYNFCVKRARICFVHQIAGLQARLGRRLSRACTRENPSSDSLCFDTHLTARARPSGRVRGEKKHFTVHALDLRCVKVLNCELWGYIFQ